MQQRNYQRGLSLVGRDIGMNAPVQAIRVQETQRTQFTMVPNILIDGYDELSDAARFGFIKFMRLVRKAGYFAGSIRKLGKKLKVANMTINRMVAAWAKFSLIRVEPIDNTDAVRVIPLTDMLWQANTDHYQYAPAEVREPVTNCDTVTVTDRSTTDTVVTICDTPSQNVTQPVTICDTVSQPQAQNDPQYLYKNIDKNKIEENISFTHVNDDAPIRAYAEGYGGIEVTLDDLEALTARLMEDVYRNQPPKISTPVIHSVDTSSHIVKATRNEAAPPPEQPHLIDPKAALQAVSATSDGDLDQSTSPPTRETKAKGKSKNGGLTLQGQHILDEYQQFKGRKSNPGKATIEAANGLVDLIASDEEFVAVLTEIRDDKFLNDHNVARDLDFVYRKYEQYRDIVEQKQTKKPHMQDNGVRLIGGKPSSELTEAEIEALPSPFLRKAARAARASC